jgi:DNA-binding SARP family transcriptional activator/tetratricopeptide (TPR) repeat protein
VLAHEQDTEMAEPPTFTFSILGPLEVRRDGVPVRIGTGRIRDVLGVLLLHAGSPVSIESLLQESWGDAPPPTARTVVHGHISHLRKILSPQLVQTRDTGYVLVLGDDDLDTRLFERAVRKGATSLATGDHSTAAEQLHAAEGLWRGTPLPELDLLGPSTQEIARLEERITFAREGRMQAELALGRHVALLPELEREAKQDVLNERLSSRLALAYYRADQQADALSTLHSLREALRDELGVDPSPAVQRLEHRILIHDPALSRPEAGLVDNPPGPDVGASVDRRLAIALVARFRHRPALGDLRAVVERHGGEIVHASKERMVALFGLRMLHEDEAVRAARTAVEIAELAGSEASFGVAGGYVDVIDGSIVGGSAEARPVRNAAMMASRAPASGIFVDSTARGLLRRSAQLAPVDPGPAGMPIFQLEVLAGAGAPARYEDAPFVGRAYEVDTLSAVFRRVESERVAALVTLLGPAGIGKSRLATDFVSRVADRSTVLVSRCLPYGSDITYWPVAEMVRQAAGITTQDPDEARRRIADLLHEAADGQTLTEHIASMFGLSDASTTTEEQSTAIQRFMETLADGTPLVLLIDDLQWAEQAFLDLIRFLATSMIDSPVMILCLARSEFLDQQPSWGGGRLNSTNILVEPLSPPDSNKLLEALLHGLSDPSALEHIATKAEGNPLYLIELVTILVEEGWLPASGTGASSIPNLADAPIPPSLYAAVRARLDQLAPAERTLLQRASIIGEEFAKEALEELASHDGGGFDSFSDLVGRDLVRPITVARPGATHRFRHLLIRDVAYEGVPSSIRADLHERFALWLETTSGQRLPEFEEIVAHHMEQAHRSLEGVDGGSLKRDALASQAGEHFAAAGHRSFRRNDARAAANQLERALDLLPQDHPERSRCHREAGGALVDLGDWIRGEHHLRSALAEAAVTGDEMDVWLARIELTDLRSYIAPAEVDGEATLVLADDAVRDLARIANGTALTRALRLKGAALYRLGRGAEAAQAWMEGVRLATENDDRRELASQIAAGSSHGPIPVGAAIEMLVELVDPRYPYEMSDLAYLYSMAERDEEANEIRRQVNAWFGVDGRLWQRATFGMYEGAGLMLEGRFAEADVSLARAVDILQRLGDEAQLSTAAALLAAARYELGRVGEAMGLTTLSESTTADDDFASAAMWRQVRARILADGGRYEEAEHLAREAVGAAGPTDWLNLRGEAHLILGIVLGQAGKGREAVQEAETGASFFAQKENAASLRRAQNVINELREGAG